MRGVCQQCSLSSQGIHPQRRWCGVLLFRQWWVIFQLLNHQVSSTSKLFSVDHSFQLNDCTTVRHLCDDHVLLAFLIFHGLPFPAILPKVGDNPTLLETCLIFICPVLRLAEMKGATATQYGLIIGTNCLVAFIVTPFIGNHLTSIGVKFAFITGISGGGACCFLSGFLEFFEPGSTFILMSVLIRWGCNNLPVQLKFYTRGGISEVVKSNKFVYNINYATKDPPCDVKCADNNLDVHLHCVWVPHCGRQDLLHHQVDFSWQIIPNFHRVCSTL